MTARERIEAGCRRELRIAAESVDAGEESIFKAYWRAHLYMAGMAEGFLDTYNFEYYDLVNYYARLARKKAVQGVL